MTETRNLIYMFLQLTIDEISAFLAGDYKRDIDIYDRLLHHTDNMGDYLTQGMFNYISSRQQGVPFVPSSPQTPAIPTSPAVPQTPAT